jgi:hypothetical protein
MQPAIPAARSIPNVKLSYLPGRAPMRNGIPAR